MLNTGRLKPTEEYPKILYYTTAKKPITDQEREELYQRNIERVKQKLAKTYTSATEERLHEMSIDKAQIMTDESIKKMTNFEKIVVNTYFEHQNAMQEISSKENFIQWG